MADKTARNGVILIGASAAVVGCFLWKFLQGGSAAQTPSTKAVTETASKEVTTDTEKKTTMTHVLHLDSSPRGADAHSGLFPGSLFRQ